MSTINETVSLEATTCAACGVVFAFPHSLMEARRDNGGTMYCPNGHPLSYNSRMKELERKLEQKEAELRAEKCKLISTRIEKEDAIAKLERHKKRTRNGVCPCCNRSFVNLQRHMKTKHPESK